MLLAIDIGNTNTVLGLFQGEKLIESWRLVSSHTRTVDEYWITVKLLCDDAGINIGEINAVIIGSVVPELTNNFCRMTEKYLSIESLIVTHSLKLGLKLLIDEPATLGADRICNIVAAKECYPLPLVVVDLGTATTFDVLNTDVDDIGGAISPGLHTSSHELVKRAAQLHKIELKYPEHLIAKTTVEHLQSGIFTGHICMIEGLISKMEKELNETKLNVVITGGMATDVANCCPENYRANPQLTLTGLRILYSGNKKNSC